MSTLFTPSIPPASLLYLLCIPLRMQSVWFGSVLSRQNPEPGWAEEGEQVSTSRRCLCFSHGVPAASPGAGPAVALRRGEARACRDTWWLPASLRPRRAGEGDPPPGSIAPRGAGGGGGGTRRVTVSWEPWRGITALKCCAVVLGGGGGEGMQRLVLCAASPE